MFFLFRNSSSSHEQNTFTFTKLFFFSRGHYLVLVVLWTQISNISKRAADQTFSFQKSQIKHFSLFDQYLMRENNNAAAARISEKKGERFKFWQFFCTVDSSNLFQLSVQTDYYHYYQLLLLMMVTWRVLEKKVGKSGEEGLRPVKK